LRDAHISRSVSLGRSDRPGSGFKVTSWLGLRAGGRAGGCAM